MSKLKWINRKKKRKGFTLVELVVVIAILGILAVIAVPKLSKSRVSAAIAAHNSNVRALESAATIAIADNSSSDAAGSSWNSVAEGSEAEKYMQEWPKVSGQIKDKTFKVEGANYEIKGEYLVNFKGNGVFEVMPKKIPEGQAEEVGVVNP